MKKIFITCLSALMLVATSCGNKEKEQQQQAIADATRAELETAVNDRDQLLELVNEISSGMQEIKNLENILNIPGENETPDQKEQIMADIAAIQQALKERRERLAELESKFKQSNINNKQLRNTIQNLTAQIDAQAAEISTLQNKLSSAHEQISRLDAKVDSLNTTVGDVKAQRDSIGTQNEKLTNELNTCYYAIGSKDELKANNILESGFLRKTKILEGDFDKNFFTKADKRTLTTINLNSKKAQVMTKQPGESYTITDVDGHKVLNITDPALFWSLSNYLVVKID